MKMQSFPLVMAPWLLLLFVPCVSGSSVTPIQKVLTMLGGMLEKAKEGKHAEQVEWSATKTMCTEVELVKQTDIQEADVKKQALKADQEQHDSEVKRLAKEILDHEASITDYKKDEKKATEDRKGERTTYETTHQDYSESITAITQAIGVLKERAADKPQKASLLQDLVADVVALPSEAKRAINIFLSQGKKADETQSLSAPEANAYEFQSDSIVTMLEGLKDKFVDERTALEKKEMIQKQAYDTVMMDLRNSINAASSEIEKKGQSKAENTAGSIESSSLFDQVSASRDEDQKALTELTSMCQQKSADFKSRQTLREEEITAVEKAIEIISGDAVSGSAEKHLPSMLQAHRGSSLVQFLSASEDPSNQQKAIAFLNAKSEVLSSHLLFALASQMTGDPFQKVKKLISDLITKLKVQEAEEGDHKKWCDDELKTNGQTRKDKTSEVDTLHSQIDQLESRLAVLKKDLAGLAKAIAEINSAVAEETENRGNEKDNNEKTIVEAVEGQTAIAKAKAVLSDFYKKAGAATAFTQQKLKEPYDEAFQGQQKQSNNVLAFLDVISSDFARLESDTKKAESAAQAAYDSFMDVSKKDKEAKDAEVKTKEKEQLEKTGDLSTKNDDLESAQKQLDAALDYFDKLKPSCVNTAVPHEERVQRREEEISALKEALEILNGEGVPSGPDSLYSSTQGGNLAVDYR
jgi:hypothetical protein